VFTVYLVSYAINTMKLPAGAALSCAVVSGVIVVTLTPFFGALSDRIGRRPLILASANAQSPVRLSLFMLAIHGRSQGTLLLALAANAVFQSMYTGTIPSILAEMFPTRRALYRLSRSVYGVCRDAVRRLCPTDLHMARQAPGNPYSPALYVMAGGALSAAAFSA